MTTYYHYARVRNWAEGVVWLAGGRNKDMRPLYHAGLFIRRIEPGNPDSPLGIGWYHKYNRQDEDRLRGATHVIYYPDGTALLTAQNMYPSARRAMMFYANMISIYTRNGKVKIRQSTDEIRKNRRRACSKCKGMTTWISKVGNDVVTQTCDQCIDGYKVTRQSFKSMTWPTQEIKVKRHWMQNEGVIDWTVCVPLLVDTSTGLVLQVKQFNTEEVMVI